MHYSRQRPSLRKSLAMSSKVELTYKTEEKGIIDIKTFFYTIKKTYERERDEEKTDEMEFYRSDCFSVDSLTKGSRFIRLTQLTPSHK